MKDFKMQNTSLEEDSKCYFGKFLSGKKNQLVRKALFILFIKSNKFYKNNWNSATFKFKKRSFNMDLKCMKLHKLLKYIGNSITVNNNILL